MSGVIETWAMVAPLIALGAGFIVTGALCMWIGRKR